MMRFLSSLRHVCMYAFVFSIPWQTIYIITEVFYGAEKWQYGTIGVYISDVFLIAWLLLSFITQYDAIQKFISKHFTIVGSLCVLVLYVFTSIIWSQNTVIATYKAVVISLSILSIIAFCATTYSFYKITWTYVASVTIQACIGIIQFVTQTSYANKFIGMQEHIVTWGGTATISIYTERWLRAYGALPHPNILAGILVCSLILALWLSTQKHRILALICIALLTLGILLTFSRAAWIAGIVSTSVLCAHYIMHNHIKKLLIPILLLCGVICMTLLLYTPLFFSRIAHDTTTSHNSFSDRTLYWQQSIQLIQQYPFHGAGIGNYTNTAYTTIASSMPIWYVQPVHNIYMLYIAELGMCGGIILVILCITLCAYIVKEKLYTSIENLTYILCILSLCLIGLFDHWIISTHVGMLLTVFCAAHCMKKSSN